MFSVYLHRNYTPFFKNVYEHKIQNMRNMLTFQHAKICCRMYFW
uniref:Uncharacterized protein n=1 Tax=Anguilla anguilla TaxID=7936 RepID=A0A0E9UCW3_ANGAN